MKAVKLFSISVPIATYSLYWLNKESKKNEITTDFMKVYAGEKKFHLEQVQVFFRHGARTPIWSVSQFSNLGEAIWDKDIFMKVLPWTQIDYMIKSLDGGELPEKPNFHRGELRGGCLTGQLTTVGQQETYDFGKWLANEYIAIHSFISPIYDANEIYIRSTNIPRTIHSAVCVMAGLFGKEKMTEPFLIHTTYIKTDDLLPNYKGCAKLHKRFRLHWSNPSGAMKDEQDAINIAMGIKEGARPLSFIEIDDIIHCRLAHQLFVPTKLLENKELILKNASEVLLTILGINRIDEIKNSVGSLVETICCRINEAIEGTCKSKILLYSTHDTSIMCLLIALGVYDGKHWPPFVANIIFELYKTDDGERLVRVLYNGSPLVLDAHSNNEEYLPVERFMKLVEGYRVLNWAEDCGNEVE